ncbi:AraC family transcriptional regulator [Blastococcus sp. TML/M2B]|uniref:helix-turn-helix domain-containing protein n=1 Tax=unclassified Blastococcus TaxID=2619396 RepID=UPI00190E3B0B|nr:MULTISPECIES: helix-turn-helix domain-containing protein [unclassified Blastococcus]MBN1093382.1 AraC family transcriptional regulator [Blastococcus sp. TML/M2B]MBN1096500.1 AraC family transcriptional regulator [Blastococcus sp. TML/C7B]
MKSDSAPWDAIARAHLKDPRDASHRMHRYEAPAEFAGLLRWFWIPVWSVPTGQEAPQKVLQYPNSLIVIAQDYARFYGVTASLSTTTLTGDGWAVGVACAPAAGYLLTGRPMAEFTDRAVDVGEVLGDAGRVLSDRVRAAMAPDPSDPAGHAAAIEAFGEALRPALPVDDEGALVNRLVAFVESRSDVTRVAQVCAEFGLGERALQRLVQRRIGLTPKWLIQRRRLQEAAERLRTDGTSLAETAAVLGYADQSHLSRDFSAVTGMTPGEFAALHARP